MHTGQELGMILLLFVVTVLMFSSLEFAFEREGETEAAVARPRDQVLYCTVLYCTVLYCAVLYVLTVLTVPRPPASGASTTTGAWTMTCTRSTATRGGSSSLQTSTGVAAQRGDISI